MGFMVFVLSIGLIVLYTRVSNLKNDSEDTRQRLDRLTEKIDSLFAENRKIKEQLRKAEFVSLWPAPPEKTPPEVLVLPKTADAPEAPSQSEMTDPPVSEPEVTPQPEIPAPPASLLVAQPQPMISISLVPITEILPTEILPTEILPTEILPTEILPTEILPTEILPTEILPTEILPTEILPTEILPTEILPTEILPTEILPTEVTSGSETQAPPMVERPYSTTKPSTPVHMPAPPRSPKLKRELNESWIGRNVVGIAASVLIFIGLLFLGVWAWNNVGDWLKVILIFVVSGILTALGIGLGYKQQNVFTKILTGCGFGAVFISIFVTYLYFRMLGAIPAYCLLFGWLVTVMAITRVQQSIYLSIVAHLGMAISICFAYVHMVDYNITFLMIYQYVSIAVIIVGNLLCYRQAYRFGLFLSFGLTIIASSYMLASPVLTMGWGTLSPLLAQFLCASFLSCLLSLSTARFEESKIMGPVHALNKLMWVAMLFVSVYLPVMRLAETKPVQFAVNNLSSPLLYPVLVCVMIVAAHIIITLFLRWKHYVSQLQETISAVFMSLSWMALLLILWHNQSPVNFPVFPYLCVPGIMVLIAERFSGNRIYWRAACVFFAVDLLSALAINYYKLQTGGVIALAAAYIVFYLCLIVFMRKKLGFDGRWERIAVYFAGLVWFVLMLMLWVSGHIIIDPNLSFMLVPGLLLLATGRMSRNKVYGQMACFFFAADLLSTLAIRYGAMPRGGVIALAAAYIVFYLGLIILMRKKLGFGDLWERASVYFVGGVWLILLFLLWLGGNIITSPNLVLMFVPGLLLLGAGRISRNRAYVWTACIFFATDLLSALAIRYGELPRGGVIALAAVYIVFYLCLIVYLRKRWAFNEILERSAVLFAGGVWLIMLVVLWLGGYMLKSPNLTFMFIPGLLLLGAGAISKNRAYGLTACVIFAADLLSVLLIRYGELTRGGVVALAAVYIVFFLCLTIFMRKKLDFGALWENRAIYFAFTVWFAMMVMLWLGGYIIQSPNLTFMFVPGLLLLGAGTFSKNRAYSWAAGGFFAADLLSVLLIKYGELSRAGVIAIAAVYIVASLCLILFMRKKQGFSEAWEHHAVYFSGGVWLVLLSILWFGSYLIKTPHLVFFCLPGLLLIVACRFSRNPSYKIAANIFFAVDLFFMLALGYREVTGVASVAPSFGYMLLFLAVIWYQWPLIGRGEKEAPMPARFAAYYVVFSSFMSILLTSGLLYKNVLLAISLTAVSILLFMVRYDGRATKYAPLQISMRVIEYLLFIVCTFQIAFAEKPAITSVVLFWLLAVLTAANGFMRIRDVLRAPNLAEQIIICVKVTVILLAIIRGFAPNWFNAVYVLSLASMVSALICVIAGFVSRAKPLRLYGLFLTLICVVKLITFDVSGLETLLRIVALIGGGIICFAISALYSYSENRLIPKETVFEEPPVDDVT